MGEIYCFSDTQFSVVAHRSGYKILEEIYCLSDIQFSVAARQSEIQDFGANELNLAVHSVSSGLSMRI